MKTLQIMGNSKYGGGTYLVIKWCGYLVEKGWHVDVLTTDEQTKEALNHLDHIKIIDHIFIPREIHLLQHTKALFSLLSFLRKEEYDVVHTYSATPSVVGRLAAWLVGINKIHHHQAGWTVVEANNFLQLMAYRIIEYISASLSTKSICVSHAIYDQAIGEKLAPKNKLFVICNGIDPAPFLMNKKSNLREKYNIPNEAIIIGTTGRLAPLKDYPTLIKSFEYLLSEQISTKGLFLLCAGSGDQQEELVSFVQKHHLESNIIFLGFVEDIPDFLANIDIFVSTSLREGLSISVMEAMAAAKPVVVSSIAPNIELIENGVNGLTFPTGDHIALAKALDKLIDNKKLWEKMGASARDKIIKEYSLDRMFAETYLLYT